MGLSSTSSWSTDKCIESFHLGYTLSCPKAYEVRFPDKETHEGEIIVIQAITDKREHGKEEHEKQTKKKLKKG